MGRGLLLVTLEKRHRRPRRPWRSNEQQRSGVLEVELLEGGREEEVVIAWAGDLCSEEIGLLGGV